MVISWNILKIYRKLIRALKLMELLLKLLTLKTKALKLLKFLNKIDMTQEDQKIIVEPKKKVKPNLPKMFKVLVLNDDFTPMEFVVDVLMKVFTKTEDEATRIMLKIHTDRKSTR